MLKFGSHVTFNKKNKYLVGASIETLKYNASAMMIYLGAPQSSIRAKPENMFLEIYEQKYMNKIPKNNILVHAPYIVNPASIEKYQFAIDFLIKEIKIMNYLGLKFLVLHPGAYTKFNRQNSVDTLIKSLKNIIKNTQDVNVLIETMSGKGTEVGTNLQEIKYILKKVNSQRLGVCLDTCHLWDAGYNIKKYDSFIEKLKSFDIIKHVKAIHINDSKNEINSHKDRHANIDKGYIGIQTLKKFIHDPIFENIIKVLETPHLNNKPIYKKEIEMLK